LTKSTGTIGPSVRPVASSRKRSSLPNDGVPFAICRPRMQPKPPLSSKTMISFRPSPIEVTISVWSIR
jgi:hypothetical protein